MTRSESLATMSHIAELRLSPDRADCGESIILTLAMRVGPAGIPAGSALVVDCPGYLGASRPQFLYQEQDGFVAVDVSDCGTVWRGGIATANRKKWLWTDADYSALAQKTFQAYRLLCLVFPDGVKAGADVRIILGAAGGGFTPGYRVGTVSTGPQFVHRFIVRLYPSPDAADAIEEHVAVLRVTPAEAVSGKRICHATRRTQVLFSDIFGNPARKDRLPIAECAPMHRIFGKESIFWGDLHTHCGLSCDCKSRERNETRPADALEFGRSAAGLDFMALTDHHFVDGSELGLSEDEWEETVAAVRDANAEGDFAAISGFEHRSPRGDTVAIFEDPPTYAEMMNPETASLEGLWREMAHRGVLTMPHFHNPGRLPEGDWVSAPDIAVEPAMEVFSCHGRFDVPRYDGMVLPPPLIKKLRGDRNADHMLKRGLRYGIMCSSDGHKGRPGTNGLVAVYAHELTTRAVFDALRQRHCYGTTNARIRLLFTINDQLMGSEINGVDRANIHIEVRGTGRLRCVELIRNGAVHKHFHPVGNTLDAAWEESCSVEASWYWVRVLQEDQEMAFSSPIWVTP